MKKIKVDCSMITRDPAEASEASKNLENLGYDGAYTFEGPHEPFLPLAAAALATEKLELSTSIAVAFSRNPMTLANIGYDLQLMSKGRFTLGLGSQIKPHIEKRYSMSWSAPAKRMKEMVGAIKAIWGCWHEGRDLDFRGEFYKHTLMTPFFNPGENPFGIPKIYVAGVGPLMTQAAAESGDGFIVHPFHTTKFLENIDAVIALPGGCGTLDELIEAITLKRLGLFLKPIVIINTQGFYNPLIEMLERCVDQNFMDKRHLKMWNVVDETNNILDIIRDIPDWTDDALKFARQE